MTAGDDRRVRVWSVEGVAGRGGASRATRDAAGHESAMKRRKTAGAAEEEEDDKEDDDDDDVDYGEPGFRSVAAIKLKHKPNGIAAAVDTAGRGLLCVATTADDGKLEVLEI